MAIARNMFGFHARKDNGRYGNLQTKGGLLYYNYDALGNVTDMTDHLGDTVAQYRFDAFGGMFAGVLAPYSYQGITGKEYDPKSGLMYYNARWYDPKVGRFTQADTFKGFASEPKTQNPYAYVGNNPINNIDPTGHASNIPADLDWDRDGVLDDLQDDAWTFDQNHNYIADWLEDRTADEWVFNDDTGWDWIGNGGNDDDDDDEDEDEDDDDNGGSGGGSPPQPTYEEILAGRTSDFNGAAGEVPYSDSFKGTPDYMAKTVSAVSYNLMNSQEKGKTETVGNAAYVFYLPEWKNEAKDDRKRLAAYYGLKEEQIILTPVINADEFKKAWNGMGTVDGKKVYIAAVVINTHANSNSLAFSASPIKDEQWFNASDISGLDDKNVGKLMIYGCNAGHLDNKENNPASQFAKK